MSLVFLQQRSVERQMLDAIGEAVLATDADGHVTYPTGGRRRLRGDRRRAVGDAGHRPARPPTAAVGSCPRSPRRSSRAAAGPVSRPSASDGSTFPHRVTLAPCFDEAGASWARSAWAGHHPEVSASAKARASEERFRRVFDESPVAMAVVSLDLRIQRSERGDGAAPRLHVRRSWPARPWRRHPPRRRAGGHRGDPPAAAGRRPDPSDPEALHPQGRRSSWVGSRARYPGRRRQPMYGIGTVEDLTATLAAYAELQDQNERLAQRWRRPAWPRSSST